MYINVPYGPSHIWGDWLGPARDSEETTMRADSPSRCMIPQFHREIPKPWNCCDCVQTFDQPMMENYDNSNKKEWARRRLDWRVLNGFKPATFTDRKRIDIMLRCGHRWKRKSQLVERFAAICCKSHRPWFSPLVLTTTALFTKKSLAQCNSQESGAGASVEREVESLEIEEYPNYSQYFVSKPDDCQAPRKNTIEQNFYILQRTKGNSRTVTCQAMCAFCAHSFQSMTSTRMRVHLTGDAEGDIRVEKCAKVPADGCWLQPQTWSMLLSSLYVLHWYFLCSNFSWMPKPGYTDPSVLQGILI